MLKRFIELFNFVRVNWNFLPNDIRSELVDCMNYYYDLVVISKYKEEIK